MKDDIVLTFRVHVRSSEAQGIASGCYTSIEYTPVLLNIEPLENEILFDFVFVKFCRQ